MSCTLKLIMTFTMFTVASCVVITPTVYTVSPGDVSALNQGEKSPCAGFELPDLDPIPSSTIITDDKLGDQDYVISVLIRDLKAARNHSKEQLRRIQRAYDLYIAACQQ